MLLVERDQTILSLLDQYRVISVKELAEVCKVTEVTIRRDLTRLEQRGLIQRTHGGAMRTPQPLPAESPASDPDCDYLSAIDESDIPDAVILAPTQHSDVHTLREHALRNGIPFLAESSPFPGAIYLGPNNYEAAFHLGHWTGKYTLSHSFEEVHVLDVSDNSLSNTRTRSMGFAEGIKEALKQEVPIFTVNGRGLYNEAYQVVYDALYTKPEINVIFGINDDSVLAGIQAYRDLNRDPDKLLAVNVGGEGKTLFDTLQCSGPLKACIALFPEMVGKMGIEAVIHLWHGRDIGTNIITPSALVTVQNLNQYYSYRNNAWQINLDTIKALPHTQLPQPLPLDNQKRLSFVIQYCTHEWYQNVAKAMRLHAAHYGIDLSIVDVNDNLAAAIRELRRLMGKLAATYVQDGDTIILDTGAPTTFMAHFLHGYRDLTVVTNSLEVFQILQNNPNITVTLTGGEYHRDSQSFVGRGSQLLLQDIRADKAFIVANGLSSAFGLSSQYIPTAEMRRAMIDATQEVIVLADHSVLGVDSRARVSDLTSIDTVITDAGALPEHRLALNQHGIKVIVAGQLHG